MLWTSLKYKRDYDKNTSLPTICPAGERWSIITLTYVNHMLPFPISDNFFPTGITVLSESFSCLATASDSCLWHHYCLLLLSFCTMPAATGVGKVRCLKVFSAHSGSIIRESFFYQNIPLKLSEPKGALG